MPVSIGHRGSWDRRKLVALIPYSSIQKEALLSDFSAPLNASGKPMTVLCLASYFKGIEFLRECKRQGCRTLLLTSQSLEGADWPRESFDNVFYVPDEDKNWKLQD